ncbi:outer membrane protein assembly factor BamD [Flavobacterium kingsejongi]|uniref:Outer membrane protein assembly factor BamD n=1 Tax=Flavobacterium kingsejongi TaxID=1678728 RepID=A0A2S1LS63_9FLAO|nr:outer membrane protein assembly factor BamD [Flavobacterium kingsejongi]AWG26603.1 outer membrane protein assembly factor BamD [Flavobacterium kingsejongi]
MNKFLALLLLLVTLSSCSEFQKALKSEDVAVKYATAEKLYEKGKYSKAIRLFEQIAPSYRGKPQAEKLFYMFSQSYYKTKQYYLSGYQFESFSSAYPKSQKREEAAFLGAKSYAQISPVYSLDQVDTYKALDKLQVFIDNYPDSEYLPEANVMVKALNEKLEKKYFEIAKQYNTISDYKAAIKALDNFILDYPGTKYKEPALFYKLDSAYKLAMNSIPSKKEERLNEAKTIYGSLNKATENPDYKEKADKMLADIETELQKFSK